MYNIQYSKDFYACQMKNKTGIYKIVNKQNQNVYYGSAAYSFESRWRHHKNHLNKNKHDNGHLQHAWNKYGHDSFEFSVVLLCVPEECLMYEQMCLDLYWDGGNNCYNIRPIAESNLGLKTGKPAWNRGIPHSTKTRKKMKKARKGHAPNRGKTSKIIDGKRMFIVRELITINGETKTINDWADFYQIKYTTVNRRIRKGWPIIDAVTTPPTNRMIRIISKRTKSGHLGVSFDKRSNKWRASICVDKNIMELGRYENKDDAIMARLAAEKKFKR